ncbi:5672_t:CDS:2 [Ambispora gerdemannii]|uniref:Glutamate-rich WD repeat-containing protein 1 n=1 Tax=Ambispora gerdemannii TaxID=144530 RepID=A0A9N8W2K5_9GLOM|nr:5672_t:CDS:2 [Ambispora gerdemannii]
MAKRGQDLLDLPDKSSIKPENNEEEIGEFEDAWEDELESEEEVSEEEIINGDSVGMEIEDDDDEENAAGGDQLQQNLKVYLPGQRLGKDEVLEADQSAYEMLHSINVQWPCLSFDILWDELGEERRKYPATAYIVAGTQADKPKNNELMVIKMTQMHKTQNDDILEYKRLKHYGGVNRVRVTPQREIHIAASWSETGKVHIWDLNPLISSLDTPGKMINEKLLKPKYTIESHNTEGFAMDWSGRVTGRLLTGDNNSNIFLTTSAQSTFKADNVPYRGHTSSVEDLQWSPSENNVFASASADQTVRIWDTRNKKKEALGIKAHEADVNVITWNRKVEYLLASGSDDGVFSIWDLRTFVNNNQKSTPVATFKWHSAPITSIEWNPNEESVLSVSGADDQISIWDLSVEHDPEEDIRLGRSKIYTENGTEGQNDIKELHWHPQIPGCIISTALTGFNVFKTISV